MEWLPNYLILFITIFPLPCLLLLFRYKKFAGDRRLPPGPPGWPVIGNILDLGTLPHRTLNDLRDKYGGVIWLRLGSRNAMAIVSAEAAGEFFRNHDLSFTDRSLNEAMRVSGFHESSVSLVAYGSHWRLLRRVLREMLTHARLDATAPIRRKCADDMVAEVERAARVGGQARGVEVGRFAGIGLFNAVGNLVTSRDLRSEVGSRLLEAIGGMAALAGKANVADFWPWMKKLDPQGVAGLMEREIEIALAIVSTFVECRREEMLGDGPKKRDFLQFMMEFQAKGDKEGANISDKDINILIMEAFSGGLETNISIIEWTMAELLRHPESMTKVKAELNRVVGPTRKLEETDIDNLPYLRAVIKESMRLHPSLPLLIPRSAVHDTTFMGYHVPKGTQVFVNAWALGRDPEAWDDPLTFMPERFVGSDVDYRGQHYGFIPFGAGRRMCAGMALAHRLLHLVFGTLLHEFDWELDGAATPKTVNMYDKLGMTLRMVKPLVAVPKKCV